MKRIILVSTLALASALAVACANPADDTELPDGGADSGDSGARVDSGADGGTADTGVDAGDTDTGAGDSGADAGAGYAFMVVRLGGTAGDGGADSGPLSNAAAPVFLDERRSSDGMLLRTLALPTTPSGSNAPLTMSGTATTEGALSRSGDGKYVVLAGYAAAPGTATVASTTSMSTNRVVGRVDANGAVDTSTRLDSAYNTAAIRAATSGDGTSFWTSGAAGSQTSGGAWYVAHGQTGGTQIFTGQTNMRVVGVFASQLYGSTQAGATLRLFTIGSGLPTTAGQTATELPGVTNTASPHGFVLLDLSNQVSGLDTAYVANDSSVANGGGVEKWTSNGSTWTLVATFKDGLTNGAIHVAADVVGANVVVVATTVESPARVVRYVDDGQNLMPKGVALTTAQPNTTLRGVALSPQ